MRIAFWGSSLVSAYWNGAATYYRGILRALAHLGYEITFYEPDAYDRQKHRDIPDPKWARIVVYDPSDAAEVNAHLQRSTDCEVVVKASGVGVLDAFLENRVAKMAPTVCKVYWDVDAPATLERMREDVTDPLRSVLPRYDVVLTYGGGKRVTDEYCRMGARECHAIYNALDPDVHFPVENHEKFVSDLSFTGNRLPDRESRVEEFFFRAAQLMPARQFLLGGNGWADKPRPENVRYIGHVYTSDHNAVNSSTLAVLNISRESMARYGFSPATRVFEAAGAGACLITDKWEGIESFLHPGQEVLIAQDGCEVASILRDLDFQRARAIGEAGRNRVLAEHTYSQRGELANSIFQDVLARKSERALAEVSA